MIFEDDFFDEWLNEEVRRVQGKIKSSLPLDADDKVILILKAQVNHFHHLDVELRDDIRVFREDMHARMEQIDRRFEQVDRHLEQVDKHLEQVDKHLEQVDRRLEQADQRFEQIDKRFEQIDKRFEQIDKRFEQMDKRFEQMDRRFEQTQDELRRLYQAINTQTWKMIGALGLIVILARLAGGLQPITG